MMLVPASSAGLPGHALRKTAQAVAALAGACVLLLARPAVADEYADVTRLLRSGQSADAMTRIDTFLDKHPRDMQMRFIKGVVLTEQGKTAEAITVFTRLTEDHPDLPEPYNNLAVLFAAGGQYDKARAALDMAIRTNPSYATAYENLGDVHAKLASQAYDKALQLDSSNAAAKSKLTLLKTLSGNTTARANTGNTGQPVGPATATAPAPIAAAAPVKPAPAPVKPAPAPVVIAKAESPTPPAVVKSEPKAEPKPEVKVETRPAPVVVAKAENASAPVKAAPKPPVRAEPASAPAAAASASQQEVLTVVNDWAAAWSAQDVKRYLAHYGNDFDTPRGEPRKAWADERTARIVGKGHIHVKVEAPQVSINGNQATVKFRQVYSSDRLQADSHKTLVLTRQGGKWQIKQERAGA